MGKFKIDADNLHWIDGSADDPNDLCLHGHVTVYIGKQKLEYDATVSAAALYLLKTLTEEHIIYLDNQMLPCCGHFFIPDEMLENVVICGCSNGIDWTVKHKNNFVVLILEDGTEEHIPENEYKAEVFQFADKIESFYKRCSPKILPKDVFERNGYIAFWNEWHRRRGNRQQSYSMNVASSEIYDRIKKD